MEDGEIVIVGTAHVSQKSVDAVREAIDTHEPDVVAVELDEQRYRSIKGEQHRDLDPKDLLEGNKPFEFMIYWLLSYLQARIGAEFGVEPGSDMIAAIEEAESRDLEVALVDRDIQVTVKRLWLKMSILEKLKFVGALILGIAGFGTGEEVNIDDITDRDLVDLMIEEFREFSPRGAEALIDERDAFIASKLIDLRNQGKSVVVVVGAGHETGIKHYLDNPETLPSMESITSGGSTRFGFLSSVGGVNLFKLGGYVVSAFIILMFVLLFMAGVDNMFLARLFLYWFLVNGVLAFTGALIAGGHIKSASVGGLVAWMTSLNPALAPGWFAGYVELRYLDISMSDIDDINEVMTDTEASFRELMGRLKAIQLFRLILVVALTNLGSVVGTGLFVFVILPWIGADVDMSRELSTGIANSWEALTGSIEALLRSLI